MKTANQSFSKELYNCQQNWPEACFCQCGGDGVVFTDKSSIEKTLGDSSEVKETLKAVLGQETSKSHYRTAFFEAFPRDPNCFLRGEGSTVQDAELDAWNKYQNILSCPEHAWTRRGRTDGYCFCSKCPLSGMFVEPLTKCETCRTPTAFRTDKNDKYFCLNHYYILTPDQAIDQNGEIFCGYTPDSRKLSFIEDQLFFNEISKQLSFTEKEWNEITHHYHHYTSGIKMTYNPLFGKRTKNDEEINKLLLEAIPFIVKKIAHYFTKKS